MWLEVLCFLLFSALVGYFLRWRHSDPSKLSTEQFQYDIDEAERQLASKQARTEDKYLVVGAGFCGLGISNSLKRHHIPFDCVEAQDKPGGNWYSGVYNNVHILSSRETTEYKDFPMPSSYPDFPSGTQMIEYLWKYAEEYRLHQHILFNTKLDIARPLNEEEKIDSQKGKELWLAQLSNGEKRVYKGVIIANGHHWDMRMPEYEGQGSFKGTIMHSKQFKGIEVFKEEHKKILVVGGGNSACDIAVEASRCCKESHISMRRGYWFIPRTIMGVPFVELVQSWMPTWLQRLMLRVLLFIVVGPYTNYGLQEPDHRIFETHPSMNSDLLNFLKLGKIAPHPDIKKFEGCTIEFVDGKREEFDVVVFATGYNISFPMLPAGLVEFKDGVPQLVQIFHPRYKNLIAFGVGQPRYGAGPLITAGSDLMAKCILKQQELQYPIGQVLLTWKLVKPLRRNNMKDSKRNDVLADPFTMYKSITDANSILKYLVWLENVALKLGWIK